MQNYRSIIQKDASRATKPGKPKKMIPSAFSNYNSAISQVQLGKGPNGMQMFKKSSRLTPSIDSTNAQNLDDEMNCNDLDEKDENMDFQEGNHNDAFAEAINVKRSSKVKSNYQGGSFLQNSIGNSKKNLQGQSNASKLQMRPNRFSNGKLLSKNVKQPQTQKNSQVRKIELISTSPKESLAYQGNNAKYQMIQNLPPSVVLKKNKKLATPAASAWVSPASSISKGFQLGSADSYKDNAASNSINRKNLMSRPIVPPHLKQQSSKYPMSANVSPKDSFNLIKNKTKSFLAAKKPQNYQNINQQSLVSKKSSKVTTKLATKPIVINLQDDNIDLRSQGGQSNSFNSKYQSFKQFQNPKSGQQTHTNTMKNSLNGSQLGTPNQSSMVGLKNRQSEQPVFNLDQLLNKKAGKGGNQAPPNISSMVSKQQSLLIQAHNRGSFRQQRDNAPFSSPSVRIPNEYAGIEENLQNVNDLDDDDDGDVEIETERNQDIGGPRAQMKSHTINLNIRGTPSQISSVSRKGSINDLPKMSFINLNQMRTKQMKQAPDQNSSFNKGSFYSGSLGNGMKLGGGNQVSQLEYIRQHGINPSQREDAGSESRVVNVNTQSLSNKMTIIRKPIQSKTTQVSAYASKNNSNHSSQVRRPSGAPSIGGTPSQTLSTNQIKYHELGTAQNPLNQLQQNESHSRIVPASSTTQVFASSIRYKSGMSSVLSSNTASLNINNIGPPQTQENPHTLKAKVLQAVTKQGYEPKKQTYVKNYSTIVHSLKSSKSKLSDSHKNEGSFVSSTRVQANPGGINFNSGNNNSNAQIQAKPYQVQMNQDTLRNKVKEQVRHERQRANNVNEELKQDRNVSLSPNDFQSQQRDNSPYLELQVEEQKETFQFEDNVILRQINNAESQYQQQNQQLLSKKKHGQPSQGSASKKGPKRMVVANFSDEAPLQQFYNQGQDQHINFHPELSSQPDDHQTLPRNSSQQFQQMNNHLEGQNSMNRNMIEDEQNRYRQPHNPQVSFCQTIDEQNYETTEAHQNEFNFEQQDQRNPRSKDIHVQEDYEDYEDQEVVKTVFNIRNDLQNKIYNKQKNQLKGEDTNNHKPYQVKQTIIKHYKSPRSKIEGHRQVQHNDQEYDQTSLPKNPKVPRVPQASPKSPFGLSKRQNSTDNVSESSQQQQLKEYYKDIQKLKKLIRLYFQEYHTIKQSTFEFYRIGRVLGRGAFGKVNLACHKVCEHLVAIKSIERKVLRNEKEQKKRVMQEMAILKQSGHDNVVRLYDTFETPLHMCFVMELCQGGDLLTYVRKRRKLKEDNAKYLFKQLVMGLNYIHTKKFVVHRDIKLDNILLDQSGRIKICDFGVSKQVASEAERMHDQCGTPAYIAPEIIKGRGYRGFKTDMWSAGICLFVMLIGTVPFRASTMDQLHELITNGKYEVGDENLSAQAQDILSQLIQIEPRKRLSAAQALQHPWLQQSQDKRSQIDVNRSDLADVIFTEKEKHTIKKDYISRLEKIKQKRFQKEPKSKRQFPRRSTLNQSSRQTDGDFIFTEHNLDTKEDERMDKKTGTQQSIKSFFKNKPDGAMNSFAKLEGFNVKPKPPSKLEDNLISNKNQEAHDNGAFDNNGIISNNVRNVSEQSIIYAPFNTSQSGFDEDHPELFEWPQQIVSQLEPKKSKILKFSKKCRDLNREYESNNNADLDNGVYNAFVNEQEAEAEKLQQKKQHQEQSNPQSLQPGGLSPSFLPQNIAFKMAQLGHNQEGNRGDEGGDELEDMNDATNLSSDDEHALASIKEFENKVKLDNNDSVFTEAKELSIHESMQRIHEDKNHHDHEPNNSDVGFNINGPARSSEISDSKIDLIIVKYTTDLFLQQDQTKSDAPVIKEFNMSPPKNSKFDSFNFNSKAKVTNLFDVKHSHSKKFSQKNPAVAERQEYQVAGGSDNAAFLSEMKLQLSASLRKQDINYLTAAYYLTRKHEFN